MDKNEIKVLKNTIIFIKDKKTLRLDLFDSNKNSFEIQNPDENQKGEFFQKQIKEEKKKLKKKKVNSIVNLLEDSFSGKKLSSEKIKDFDEIEKKIFFSFLKKNLI